MPCLRALHENTAPPLAGAKRPVIMLLVDLRLQDYKLAPIRGARNGANLGSMGITRAKGRPVVDVLVNL